MLNSKSRIRDYKYRDEKNRSNKPKVRRFHRRQLCAKTATESMKEAERRARRHKAKTAV